jgi:hypothetical protein
LPITKGSTVVLDITAASNTTDFGGGQLWQETGFSSNTIEQSLVIDYKNNTDLIFVQSKSGATAPDAGGTQGDMDLNRMNYAGVRQNGMYLRHEEVGWGGDETDDFLAINEEFNLLQLYKNNANGFGHGTQIALEYAPDGMYIWTDYESLCLDRTGNKTEGGYGREGYTVGKRLVRFKYQDGKTYIYGDSTLKTFTLTSRIAGLLDSGWATVSIDNVNKLLGVKYIDHNKVMKCTIFSFYYNADYPTTKYMSDIIFTELFTFSVPSITWPKANEWGYPRWTQTPEEQGKLNKGNLVPNGWALFGDYVYLVYGTAYFNSDVSSGGQNEWFSPTPAFLASNGGSISDGIGGTYTKAGNTQIIRYNWKTGVQVKSLTEAGKSLVHREPEGCFMVPQMDEYGNVGALELHFAFAGGIPGARNWTLMNKFSFC